jgi:hypothetical protein
MATKTPIGTPVRPDAATQQNAQPAPQLGLSMKNRLGFTMIVSLPAASNPFHC